MSQFERCILKKGQQITIDAKDKQIYTKDFDVIRDYILNIMREEDEVFNKICKGPSLFGSYANNVRINCPDEFDVHIKLCPPFAREIIVEVDEDRPGFVKLNFRNVLEKLSDDPNLSEVYDCLYELTDRYYYLIRGRVQAWLKDLIEDGLSTYGSKVRGYSGDLYTLIYSKRGLAHTIFAECQYRKMSIDFVPAFKFGQKEWMTIPNNHKFKFKCEQWYALPKPTGGPKHTRRISFMICNPLAEHHLLLKRQNLKIVFRLLKALRKCYRLRRLKSYFITTIFLWEVKKQTSSFWNNSVGFLLMHMLDVLSDYFVDDCLPFFWNDDVNLLGILNPSEITFYTDSLIAAYNILSTYTHQPNIRFSTVAKHFDC